MKKFDINEASLIVNRVASDVAAVSQAIALLKTVNSDHLTAVLGGAHYDLRAMDQQTVAKADMRIQARAWQDWLYNNGFNHRYGYSDRQAEQATKTLVFADLFNNKLYDGVKMADMEVFSIERAQYVFDHWLADTPNLLSRMLNNMKYSIGKKQIFAKKFTFTVGTYSSDYDYKIANLHYIVAVLAGIDFTYQQFYIAWRNTNKTCDVFSLFEDEELISFEKQASGNFTVRLRCDIADKLNELLAYNPNGVITDNCVTNF